LFDNGLLEYYRCGYYREGFLDAKEIKVKESIKQDMFKTCVSCKSPVGTFYKKYHRYFSKEMTDAEILLGQVYNKLGIKSAIYVPVQEDGKKFLLSNSILQNDIYPTQAFHEFVSLSVDCEEGQVRDFLSRDSLSSDKSSDILKYFSDRAIEQKVKMRLVDCASNNTDRADCNYMYQIDDDRVCQDVVVFDHERSGIESLQVIKAGVYTSFTKGFKNDFGLVDSTSEEVVEEVINNPLVNSVVNRHALAEQIGNADISQVALDISRTTGYVVEPSYVNFLEKSFYKVATQLDK